MTSIIYTNFSYLLLHYEWPQLLEFYFRVNCIMHTAILLYRLYHTATAEVSNIDTSTYTTTVVRPQIL